MVPAQGQSPFLTPAEAMKRAKPCSCHPGLEQIANMIEETKKDMAVWEQIAQETGQHKMTQQDARDRFRELGKLTLDDNLFGCKISSLGTVGKTQGHFFFCKPLISQAFADCACDVIVASTIDHEEEHCFVNSLPNYFLTLNVAQSLAGSEFRAHEEQIRYLEQAEENLRNSPKCKPKPPNTLGQKNDAGQPPPGNAAKRVGQYAAGIH